MDDLSALRKLAGSRRFALGSWDCALFCAEWFRMRHGEDIGAAWRGRYKTPLGLQRLLRAQGGLVALFDGILAPRGFLRTIAPQRGDIAVVETLQGQVAGVVAGQSVLMVGERGFLERALAYAPVVAAWRV